MQDYCLLFTYLCTCPTPRSRPDIKYLKKHNKTQHKLLQHTHTHTHTHGYLLSASFLTGNIPRPLFTTDTKGVVSGTALSGFAPPLAARSLSQPR